MRVGSTGRGRSPAPPLRRTIPASKTRVATELAPGAKVFDSAAPVKAMLSEVVRIGLHRAEDIATLSDRTKVATHTTMLQCKYREEWRCNREDTLLDQLRASPPLLAGVRDEDERSLVVYFRRILHGMVQTIAGKESATDENNKTPSKAQQLQRAVHLDRIIGRIEAHDPIEICRDMMVLSRKQLATLLVETPEMSETREEDASSVVQPLSSMVTNVVRVQATYLPASQPSSSFERLVHAQRYAKEVRTNETLAKAHRRLVAIRRIQRWYRRSCAQYLAHLFELERQAAAAALLRRRLRPLWRRRIAWQRNWEYLRRWHTARRLARWVWYRRCLLRSRLGMDLLQLITLQAHDAARTIQSHLRRVLATRRVRYLASMVAHRKTRYERRLWAARQHRHQAMAPLVTEMLEWHCMVSVEVAATTQSMAKESADFERQWNHYATTLTKACLKAKLSDEWVPQMDVRNGACYYFNLKTATTQSIHPNILFHSWILADRLLVKQRRRAHDLYKARMTTLSSHLESLRALQAAHTADLDTRFRQLQVAHEHLV